MRKVLFSIALAGAAVTLGATPAAAQRGFGPANEIRRDIDQLENRIERAADRRTISRREAVSLRREANQTQQLFYRYQRNGLNAAEIRDLRGRINRVQYRLRAERRDGDNRRY